MHIATSLQFGKGPRKVLKRAWERPPFMVAKRNARERTRVHAVNQAFVALKFHLPAIRSNAKRVSKLKILRAAINYIAALTDLLRGNADFSKLNASSYYCDDNINVPFRSRRENQLSNKDNVKREELQQRQQCIIPQNIYDTTQCYNKQYWLVDYSLSN
ncbi:Helix-loop-helix DNA-binding domain containing protein [Brugia malayi]|uniref:BMA-HLH-4 n=1 Tax=Brugia malayi TaxID=6279 RepID=A0A0K0JJI4_BRUMA|nr:Helix-loop-helix DNA-binding domain containing protein [Brugia malayi]CRZ25724.1 BMA-HLH-4 [Brugia malayi]VIO90997.1 Helix-loop-helix DNA-binding domain containing protein [Brugia malayi]